MDAHGVQEQKWNRNTSNSGLSRQLLMQRYENTGFEIMVALQGGDFLLRNIKLNVALYRYMFE